MIIKNKLSNRTIQLLLAIAVIFLIMSAASPKTFLSITNFKSILVQISDIGLFSLAMAVTMIAGGIDLSIINLANLIAVINAILIKRILTATSSPGMILITLLLCFAISLLIGLIAGCLNAFLIAKLKIPEILATLGTMNLFFGLASIITKGQGIIGFPQMLLNLGSESILNIPIIFLIFAITSIILFVIIHWTAYGRQLFFFGLNRKASYYSGIDNVRVIFKTYIISGLVSAVAGLMVMARTNSATIDYGSTIILVTLLIGVLSGISPLGGSGKIYNIFLALLVMQLLNSGLNLLQISNFIRETTPAFLLVCILSIEFYLQAKSEKALNKRALDQIVNVDKSK